MYTKNLKDLKRLVPVASAQVGQSQVKVYGKTYTHRIEKEDYPEDALSLIWDIIQISYKNTVNWVNQVFQRIYRKPVRFTGAISDFLIKIKTIMNQTGKTIEQIVQDIRSYLGYNCSFHRFEGDRSVPITSERILKAYELTRSKQNLIAIENVLYL
jgi:hypothetical protein